jgi:hypothetical protein
MIETIVGFAMVGSIVTTALLLYIDGTLGR